MARYSVVIVEGRGGGTKGGFVEFAGADRRSLGALARAWSDWTIEMLRIVMCARVALVGGVILFFGPVLANGSELFGNMLELRSRSGLILVMILMLLAAWQCAYVYVLNRDYAHERLRDLDEREKKWSFRRLFIVAGLVLAGPGVICVVVRYQGPGVVTACVVAGVFFVLFVWLAGRLDRAAKRDRAWSRLGMRRTMFLKEHVSEHLWRGYVAGGVLGHLGALETVASRRDEGTAAVILPHLVALSLLAVTALIYFGLGCWTGPDRGVYAPGVVYVLLMFILVVSGLGGMAFFFDRLRVPLLLVVVVTTFVKIGFHGPRLAPVYRAERAVRYEDARAILARSGTGGKYEGVVVVVCASGGGIQAAAWTSRVLTWLQEELGEDWTRSVRFYSAASGGSVGVMHFVNAIDPSTGAVPPPDLEAVRLNASRASLQALSWGLCYPDFKRAAVPFGAVGLSEFKDRAWALERSWRVQDPIVGGSERLSARWSDWVELAGSGLGFPGVAFNSLDVRTGRRVVIANVSIPLVPDAVTLPEFLAEPGSVSIDIDVVTAARLSATFPYVTPIAAPAMILATPRHELGVIERDPGGAALRDLAFGDGGYFDNTGLMTGVEWLRYVLPDIERSDGPVIDHVIVVEIRAFPRASASVSAGGGGRWQGAVSAWASAVAGPLGGLMNTRSASQVSRGELELGLLMERHGRVSHVVFEPGDGPWSLSWQLSDVELARLDAARHGVFACTLAELREVISAREHGQTGRRLEGVGGETEAVREPSE